MQQILVDTDVVSLLMKGSLDAEKFKPYMLDRGAMCIFCYGCRIALR